MNKKYINISNQEGLDLLKEKAKYYDYYAENLMVLELIKEIEDLKNGSLEKAQTSLQQYQNGMDW